MAFLPIDRKIFRHAFFEERREFSRFEAWLDLIQMARFEAGEDKKLINGRMIKWERGQVLGSARFLQDRWIWGSGKVVRFLDMLKNEGMISIETEQGASVITICKYDDYNIGGTETERKRNANGTEAEHKRNDTKKENNVKKVKKEKKITPAEPLVEGSLFSKLLNEYNEFLERVAGVPEQFSVAGRKSLSDIQKFLIAAIQKQNDKKQIIETDEEIEIRAFDGWKLILDNHAIWPEYLKNSTKIEQIKKNIIPILTKIKNGTTGNKSKIGGIGTTNVESFFNMEIKEPGSK